MVALSCSGHSYAVGPRCSNRRSRGRGARLEVRGAAVGASLSVVAIPAGPSASRGPPAREGGGHRGSPVPRPRFTRSAPAMPATNQWAVSTLIREVLADPDLAHDDVFRRLPPGRAAGPGRRRGRRRDRRAALRAHPAAHQPPQRHEAQDGGHHRRAGRTGHPQASHRVVLPLPAPPAQARGQGPDARRAAPRGVEGVSTRKVDDLVKALGNESGISRSTVSRIRDGHRRGRARVPRPPPGPHLVPLLVRGRHVPGREGGAPGGLPGAGGGHRRVGPRAPGDPGHGPGRRRDHRFLDLLPAVPARARPQGPLTPRPRGRGPGHQ